MSVSLHIKDIWKSYEAVDALKGITLDVKAGELFGFIGPDGAGKTSIFRILTSLILPSRGKATIDGLHVVDDYKAIRKITGYMPGRFSLYPDLTVEENLDFYASIFNTSIQANYELIKDIYSQIEAFKKRKAGDLSGGMKQKLALSCALIHKPKLLILDEPTTGVDAVSRKEFWELLKKMQQNGITILVSTPYMDEAALCDRVALLQKGNLLAADKPEAIIKSFKGKLFAISTHNMYPLLSDLEAIDPANAAYRFGASVHYTCAENKPQYNEAYFTKLLTEKGHEAIEIQQIKPVIEDCFLALMDQNLEG